MNQPTGNLYPHLYPGEPPPPYAPPGQQPPQSSQYPPPNQQPQQYPPSSYPRQQYGTPSSAPGAYYPPPAPGQYPPAGALGQYPPPITPRQNPPPTAPGQYPPATAPGQYPPPTAPGQYPPPTTHGQYPPPTTHGQNPPPGAPGTYPVQNHVAVTPPPSSIGPEGYDTFDSDTDDYVCTKDSRHPMEVTFTNKTRKKATLYWIDEGGQYERITSLKPNASKDIDTWETHPFFAEAKNELVINGNFVFIPRKFPGSHGNMKAEITEAPKDVFSLRSPLSGFPVTVKFSNCTKEFVSVKWMNVNGQPQPIKDIAPGKAWIFHSCEGHYFTACERGYDDRGLELNKGWFYLVGRGPDPQSVTKVLITRQGDADGGSSSSDE